MTCTYDCFLSECMNTGMTQVCVLSVSVDINECGNGSSCCEQECTNYPGGYECYCTAGHRLNADGCSCDGTISSPLDQFRV